LPGIDFDQNEQRRVSRLERDTVSIARVAASTRVAAIPTVAAVAAVATRTAVAAAAAVLPRA
jgi:hypothetical protein